MDQFLIGDVLVCWSCQEYTLDQGYFMERFRHTGRWDGDRIVLRGQCVSLQPFTGYPCLERNRIYDRYDIDGEPLLIYHWGHLRNAFAIWPCRTGTEEYMCMFDPALTEQKKVNADWFFGVSGLHGALLQRQALIVHASYVDHQGNAILFTAPSGTGKSTQAELWQEHAGADIINGDRVLLRMKDGHWHAYGFPCCGSSNICIDRTRPIAVIVVLEQGKKNEVIEISGSQKIRALLSATEVNLWDTAQIDQAIEIVSQLVDRVPVIKLSCTPDKNAVDALQQYLKENSNG